MVQVGKGWLPVVREPRGEKMGGAGDRVSAQLASLVFGVVHSHEWGDPWAP